MMNVVVGIVVVLMFMGLINTETETEEIAWTIAIVGGVATLVAVNYY